MLIIAMFTYLKIVYYQTGLCRGGMFYLTYLGSFFIVLDLFISPAGYETPLFLNYWLFLPFL